MSALMLTAQEAVEAVMNEDEHPLGSGFKHTLAVWIEIKGLSKNDKNFSETLAVAEKMLSGEMPMLSPKPPFGQLPIPFPKPQPEFKQTVLPTKKKLCGCSSEPTNTSTGSVVSPAMLKDAKKAEEKLTRQGVL